MSQLLTGPISHSALIAIVSHFLELEAKLELLGFGRSVDLIENEAGVLWT
jgi:hypothetical protein